MSTEGMECKTFALEQEGDSHQLLPGIPNDVVLHKIAPRLPWRVFHVLSSVSHCWRQAVQTRQVYDARVRSNTTERLVVINHTFHDSHEAHAISLYSMGAWHLLPQLPHSLLAHGTPWSCQCIALDGKVYLLGGVRAPQDNTSQENPKEDTTQENTSKDNHLESGEVFVLDVAGQWGWKRCSNMPQPRRGFGCGSMGGKIYVFGGAIARTPTHECWVYNPPKDSWSSIKPMPSARLSQAHFPHVVPNGEELLLWRRLFYDNVSESTISGHMESGADMRVLYVPNQGDHRGSVEMSRVLYMPNREGELPSMVLHQEVSRSGLRGKRVGMDTLSREVYHPGKDEWRVVKPLGWTGSEALFTIEGGQRGGGGGHHVMSLDGIYVWDMIGEENHWTCLHSFSIYRIQSSSPYMNRRLSGFVPTYYVCVTLPADDELLALVNVQRFNHSDMCLIRSIGFGGKNEEIGWEEIVPPLPIGKLCPFYGASLMCHIEL